MKNERTIERTNERKNEQMNERTKKRTNDQMNQRIYKKANTGRAKFCLNFSMPTDYWKTGKTSTLYVVIWRYS